jgi:hypothetical protein
VNGYFAHGFHVFNPDGLLRALEGNGFEILYKEYTSAHGRPLDRPDQARDVLLWLVARKTREVERLVVPQQSHWDTYYHEQDPAARAELHRRYRSRAR